MDLVTRTWGEGEEVGIEFRLQDETGRGHTVCDVRKSRDIFAGHRLRASMTSVYKIEINWSAWGSQDVATTQEFVNAMAAAIGVVRMLEAGLSAESVRSLYAAK